MGADMTLAGLPAFQVTPTRAGILEQIAGALTDEELPSCADREEVAGALADFLSMVGDDGGFYSRECTWVQFPGMPYGYWLTGGLSWGDSPTELYNVFETLSRCTPIDNKCHEFAAHDAVIVPV